MAIIQWPLCVLRPQSVSANLVPYTRSGGRTLGGVEPATRTDLGFWSVEYSGVVMRNKTRASWQTWSAIRQKLGGKSGLIAVPVRSSLSAPYVSGHFEPVIDTEHDDDTLFDDDTPYVQGAISVVTDGVTAVGATSIKLRIINADDNLVGTRFSYNHALYETGPVTEIDGDIWTVPISPSVRGLIPAGADLEFDQPTCLCHLVEDRGMDVDQNAISKQAAPSVSFVEAVDYWSNL
ncbi:hypothetical protein CWR43_28170 [Rhizobium sullae]|uniref:Uncharacterized protein n=2 Tax=Rhizobium sullae TaxID=50338 RepID=A0A2N0D2U8_RHISU|nr:hypothetical protein CWR43_28170 [Rhizobium sullae]